MAATNNGSDTAAGVTVSDLMPAGNTLVSATTTQESCTGCDRALQSRHDRGGSAGGVVDSKSPPDPAREDGRRIPAHERRDHKSVVNQAVALRRQADRRDKVFPRRVSAELVVQRGSGDAPAPLLRLSVQPFCRGWALRLGRD